MQGEFFCLHRVGPLPKEFFKVFLAIVLALGSRRPFLETPTVLRDAVFYEFLYAVYLFVIVLSVPDEPVKDSCTGCNGTRIAL